MKLLPPEPTFEMLLALAGDPALLAASDEAELRKRYQAMRDSAPEYVSPRQIVEQHRRHVELSPGAGEDVQKYALAVCDDILADLDAARMSSSGASDG